MREARRLHRALYELPRPGGIPGQFAEFHKRETGRWSAVVKTAGIKPE